MLAAGIILLIACANLAGLTLVRILRRTPEIVTRLALGSSYGQIQKQLWVENLLLALVGGSAGIAAGFVALRGLLHRCSKRYSLLFVPNAACMSSAQCAMIRQYVEGGGRVIATHLTSVADEYGKPLADFGLADLFGASRIDAEPFEYPDLFAF